MINDLSPTEKEVQGHQKIEEARTIQIQLLEQLQKVIDENNILRFKYNALKVQVPPENTTPNFIQEIPAISQTIVSEHELTEMRQRLENILENYKIKTKEAGEINKNIEQLYKEMAEFQYQHQVKQDEALTNQNYSASQTLENFRAKSKKLRKAWDLERERLKKSIQNLHEVNDLALSDIKEYNEQIKSNIRGLNHISTTITVSKEDIKENKQQLKIIQPQLEEFSSLTVAHQKAEMSVVELSDQLEQLQLEVDTNSLTSKIRSEINDGNMKITNINNEIDKIQGKTQLEKEKIKQKKQKIAQYDEEIARVKNETKELLVSYKNLKKQKQCIQEQLRKCMETKRTTSTENTILKRKLNEGIHLKCEPWQIRHEILYLKHDLKESEYAANKQDEIERKFNSIPIQTAQVPMHRRVPMIPLSSRKTSQNH